MVGLDTESIVEALADMEVKRQCICLFDPSGKGVGQMLYVACQIWQDSTIQAEFCST